MSFFEVPGWSVPDTPVTTHSKKRKRPANDPYKLHATEVNIEKLMSKLGAGQKSAAEDQPRKKKSRQVEERLEASSGGGSVDSPTARNVRGVSKGRKAKKLKSVHQKSFGALTTSNLAVAEKPGKWNKKKGMSERPIAAVTSAASTNAPESSDLTDFQTKLQSSLHGARFRWINETLYKSDSEHAHKMMRETPSMFSEYHTGFRRQVRSWPSNPVLHYISALSLKPPKTVIADLGCGDAALARTLQSRGFSVLSYDLVSDNEYVIEADICAHIPLPGAEESDEGAGGAQIVDVAVCALSLMGTNWPKCVREAWRILRLGGELRVAEVASRFTDLEAFTSLVGAIGFKLRSTDDSNTHFKLFEFIKVTRKPKSDREWNEIMTRGEVLKPCEYKRR